MEADARLDTPPGPATATATARPPAHQDSISETDQSTWKRFRSQFNPRPIQDDKPRTWWFASTAIPLIAAATAPFANVMSIVALAMPWRSTIHYDKTGNDGLPLQVPYDDLTWSVALNATSLACGVIGNIFLLCNFTQAVRYIVALPVSIVLWWLATGILIGITSAVHIYAPPALPHQLYTTAFYFAVIAACLYFFNTLILTINLLGYLLGHYPQHFALSNSQRTLILQTTALAVWLIVGAAIFQKLIGISFSDALYFSDITILTLGFGDILAKTPVARGIIFPYAVFGIVMLGLVIGSMNQFFGEIEVDNVVRKRIDRKRKALVETSPISENVHSHDQNTVNIHSETSESASPSKQSEETFTNTSTTAFSHIVLGQRRKQVSSEEKDRFRAMRTIQKEVASFRRWFTLIQCLISFAIVWTIGALVFCTLQPELTYFDALYFNFVCLLSIGYGDITPNTNSARAFFVLWSLIAVPTMTTLISVMSDTFISAFQRATNMLAGWSNLSKSPLKHSRFMRIPLVLNIGWTREAEQNSDISESADEEQVKSSLWSQQERPFPSSAKPGIEWRPSDMDVIQKLTYAIRRVTQDALDGGNQYSYEEWAEFMQMIQLSHSRPGELNMDKDEYGRLHWDWIGEWTPMMSKQSESEWILDRLCESMIRCSSMHGKRCPLQNEEIDRERHEYGLTKEADIGSQEGNNS
ncbi:ion channel [Penicillium argentinense]|uniref:Ion channel n=1 Tax=Penicillium argentinense TaxID=1131581 RepID=A0A9W9G3Q4_9EURO|nr:ion channel [Penicillium argentinense]KAJ5111411.1 ion channel [Penicillium argentinense]